ncbi:MAG: acetate uptake transporter [Actinomycetota bacterium]|nr:acetate uptake transporter [Actinomycetota bacterium]
MAQHEQASSTPAGVGVGFADPGPLGLAGFAATTFFLSVVNTGMLPASVETGVLGLAFFYGGIVQVLAGMWEFAKGNTFGAVAFASFGAFWLSFWFLLKNLPDGSPSDVYHAVGVYLLIWTIFTAYMTVAALKTNGAILAVFAVLTLTFLALTIGWLDNHSGGWIKLGGWLGILTAVLAWYTSAAGVINATFKRAVLPTFARS